MGALFFAQLFGLYFIIVGAIMIWRKKSFMPVFAELAQNRLVLYILAFLELAAGLALIIAYPKVEMSWLGIISLVGWILAVESIFYLTVPTKTAKALIAKFNNDTWYTVGGVLSIILGAYLAHVGFGIGM